MAMKETLQAVRHEKGAPKRQYEYLILSVRPDEPAPLAYQRLREHAEYGKWELERSARDRRRHHETANRRLFH